MLSKGSGLFRVKAEVRKAAEKQALEKHPWRARLEAHLQQASEHGADWIYFRLECDAGGPKPEIFIYDRTSRLADGGSPSDVAKLHHDLWNYGKVPLAFFLRPTTVEIINLLLPPEFGPKGDLVPRKPLDVLPLSPADTLAAAGAASKGIAATQKGNWERFSARYFDNGSFWEMPQNHELGKADQGSVASMVREMRQVRDKLEKQFKHRKWLPPERAGHAGGFVRRLLIITLMVRFMEDRGILPRRYFADKEFLGATDFKSLLRHKTALIIALDRLARDFNGDVFTLEDGNAPGDVPVRSILQELPDKALEPIADFADGNMSGEQRLFWERYSFRHLPVEAISYVYEDFLGGKSQAFFTPHHLVDLLLDESMTPERVRAAYQRNDPRKAGAAPAFPVLDPACGSGVFLVGAWHRLVEALYLLDESPSPEILKRLMEQNIYGVDIEPDSVELTIFSLCVALSSAFPRKPDDPDFIFNKLRELKFPNLKQDKVRQRQGNVIRDDFFAARGELLQSPLRFQLIIGNPPFESDLKSETQRALDKTPCDEDGKNWEPVPDHNISYLFLRSVPPLLAEGGSACLVQPASLLYNEGAAGFRKALFTNWHIPEILDFASVSGLFRTRKEKKLGGSDTESKVGVKTVAVLIERRVADASLPLLHVTFRRTMALGQRQLFEVDPQDLHWIPRELAKNEPRVWKADLLGGGRLLETYKSLTSDGTVEHRIKALKPKGWVCSEGFIAADVKSYGAAAKGAKTRYKPQHRPHYAKMDLLDTEGLSDSGLDSSRVKRCGLEWFLWPRDERLFQPPHLLIKEHESFPMVLREGGKKLLFKDQIVGIACPAEQIGELEILRNYLMENRRICEFFAAFGSKYLIFRQSALLKKIIMDLPYPKSGKLVFRGVQKHLRDDVINFMIPLIKDNDNTQSELGRSAKQKEAEGYSDVFVEVMKSTYPHLRFVMAHDLGSAWCLAFHKGADKAPDFGDTAALIKHLDGLIQHDMGRALRCWRIVRHFSGKDIYIIKPKPRRYWLKSAAVRDADEMFASAMSHALQNQRRSKPARD